MLNALRRVQSGEVTTSIYHKGVWSTADTGASQASALRRNDEDMLHAQIGIAIGYGYVIGTVSVESDRVQYTQLTLTSKGQEFLAAMQSAPTVPDEPGQPRRTKLLAGTAFVAVAALLVFLVMVFVPRV